MFADALGSQCADHASINLHRFSGAVAAAATRTMPRLFIITGLPAVARAI
jgi:hypothetical protein